jgi:hypothetical protein
MYIYCHLHWQVIAVKLKRSDKSICSPDALSIKKKKKKNRVRPNGGLIKSLA